MAQRQDPLVIGKNRKRALWSLAIVLFMVPVSGLLVVLGLQPGRPDVAWALVLFGAFGIVAFIISAVRIIRTMRAPWRLELTPHACTLYTPTYDLDLPWDGIAGIAVDEVNRRPGCVLVLEDPAAAAQGARFHRGSNRHDAVTDAATMKIRMETNYDENGYHLAIPGRLLELGPEALAELLTRACKGVLWPEQEERP